MMSFIKVHHFFITGCEERAFSLVSSSAFIMPNRSPEDSSRKIWYSEMPADLSNNFNSSGISSCRFLYSASNPLCNRILKATFLILSIFPLVEHLFNNNDLPQVIMSMFYHTHQVSEISSILFITKYFSQLAVAELFDFFCH